MDLQGLARDLVQEHFSTVRAALLSGSAAEGRANAYSDLDIVVVLDGPPAPYRETVEAQGWPVEFFVHTDESLDYWFGRDLEEGRCTLAYMIATGVALSGQDVQAIVEKARDHVDRGPTPWTTGELQYRRYVLTDALEDLLGARDADERDAVAGQILTMAAELFLASQDSWQGKGKWMLRWLRICDPALADDLFSAHRAAIASDDRAQLVRVCETILQPLGGRLTAGFLAR